MASTKLPTGCSKTTLITIHIGRLADYTPFCIANRLHIRTENGTPSFYSYDLSLPHLLQLDEKSSEFFRVHFVRCVLYVMKTKTYDGLIHEFSTVPF